MREILFCGKRVDNKEWATSPCHYGTMASGTIIHDFDSETVGQYTGIHDSTKWEELIETEKEAWLIRHTADEWKGKLIFEGNILQCNNNPNDLIVAVFGEFDVIDMESLKKIDRVIGWHYEVITTDALSKCEPFCLPMPLTEFYIERMNAKVIGNIHDNPKLIEIERNTEEVSKNNKGGKQTMTINEMVRKAHENAQVHGFYDHPPELGTMIALVHSELSEALEALRKDDDKSFAVELADAVIRIADLCGYCDIDLEATIEEKMKYNETRPYKHGKKF